MKPCLAVFLRGRIILAVFTVLCLSAGCIPVGPKDVNVNIAIGEAQKLLPFTICLPGYVPDGIKQSVVVHYHNEFGDPNESDVTIDFVDEGNSSVVFTLYERHGPGQFDPDDESTRTVSLRQLLAWQVGWPNVNDMENRVVYDYQTYHYNTDRLIVEILSPDNMKAVDITWLDQFEPSKGVGRGVMIDLYSRLSLEETIRIANSVPACTLLPLPTP